MSKRNAGPMKKVGMLVNISAESLYSSLAATDEMFARKVESVEVIEPSADQWRQYKDGVRLLAALRSNPFYVEGGPDEASYIEEPHPRRVYTYAETEQEWLARCAALAGV